MRPGRPSMMEGGSTVIKNCRPVYCGWAMAGFSEQYEGVVAIDGKVLRRSFDSASGKSPLHMVSACENLPPLPKF